MSATPVEKSTEADDFVDDEELNIHDCRKTPVTLEGKQGHFKEVETVHEKYSLAQFATSYTYVRADKIPKEIKWLDNASQITSNLKLFGEDEFLPKYISLDSGTYMALRTKPLVLRIHSSKKKEYLEGIYSELLLYLPWRSEKGLKKGSSDDCVKLFNDNKDIIDQNRKAILPYAPLIDSMRELLDAPDGTRPLH